MKKGSLIVIVLASITTIESAQESLFQYDGKASYVHVDSNINLDSSGSEGFTGVSRFHAKKFINDKIILDIDNQYRGVTDQSLFPENSVPSENVTSGGITLSGRPGDLYAGYSNALYMNAHATPVPWLKSGTAVRPLSLNTIEGSWDLELEWFRINTVITSCISSFQLEHADQFNFPPADNKTPPFGNNHDADIWAYGSAGFYLPLDFLVQGGMFIKNDLSDNYYYNINEYWLELSSDQKFSRKRIIVSFKVRERFLQSVAMHESGYADGLATDANLRLQLRLNSKFFIKAASTVSIAPGMLKQYYELQLRKTWNDYSSLDLTYFATNGVLFPRQGLQATTSLRLTNHFGFSPSVAEYIEHFPYESTIRLYRSDYGLELFFPLNDRIELYSNAKYITYNNHPLFSSRFFIASGLRAW